MANNPLEAIQKLLSAETNCHCCGDKIEAGEYRVLVVAVECGREDDPEETPGPGTVVNAPLCDVCCGETPMLPVSNPWYREREARAHPSAGPAREDVSWRAESLQGMAAEKAARNAESGVDGDSAEDNSAAAIEANLNSTMTRTHPVPEPPSEDDLRNRMERFLRTPEARKMPKQLRTVADKWAGGENQTEIARAMGVNQSTVSRWLEEAQKWLYR